MNTWPVPRALALLLLVQTLKLVESTESQTNPLSQPSESAEPVGLSLKPIKLFIDGKIATPIYDFTYGPNNNTKIFIFTAKEGLGFNKVLKKNNNIAIWLKGSLCCLCDWCFCCWYNSSDGQTDSDSKECTSDCCKSKSCQSDCCKNGCCKSDCCNSGCCKSQVVDDDESVPSGCCLFSCLFGCFGSSCCKSSCCKSRCCKSKCCKSNCCKNGCGSNCCSNVDNCCDPRENKVIWRASNDKELATKVEVDESGSTKTMTLTMADGSTKKLELKNKRWIEVSSTSDNKNGSNSRNLAGSQGKPSSESGQ